MTKQHEYPIDRTMSSWVVTARKQGTMLYLTDDGLYSDILNRARLFRWLDQAEAEASEQQQSEPFGWRAMSYPAAFLANVRNVQG